MHASSIPERLGYVRPPIAIVFLSKNKFDYQIGNLKTDCKVLLPYHGKGKVFLPLHHVKNPSNLHSIYQPDIFKTISLRFFILSKKFNRFLRSIDQKNDTFTALTNIESNLTCEDNNSQPNIIHEETFQDALFPGHCGHCYWCYFRPSLS